ncbi:MAG: hypothetical protein M0D55_09295 [Elusimicrobiota bacterium]|nr:MAG: hypothetical protein M0D55_09295 [Elusimicrobiota bacterium]
MSLKAFHRFFIALSLGLFAFMAYWASGRNASGLVTPWLVWASAAGLAASVGYLYWHVRSVRLPS